MCFCWFLNYPAIWLCSGSPREIPGQCTGCTPLSSGPGCVASVFYFHFYIASGLSFFCKHFFISIFLYALIVSAYGVPNCSGISCNFAEMILYLCWIVVIWADGLMFCLNSDLGQFSLRWFIPRAARERGFQFLLFAHFRFFSSLNSCKVLVARVSIVTDFCLAFRRVGPLLFRCKVVTSICQITVALLVE